MSIWPLTNYPPITSNFTVSSNAKLLLVSRTFCALLIFYSFAYNLPSALTVPLSVCQPTNFCFQVPTQGLPLPRCMLSLIPDGLRCSFFCALPILGTDDQRVSFIALLFLAELSSKLLECRDGVLFLYPQFLSHSSYIIV